MVETIRWIDNCIRILDQSSLPIEEKYIDLTTIDQLIEAIQKLRVRGAPALGIAGAFGLYLVSNSLKNASYPHFKSQLIYTSKRLIDSRPTAVNLKWGVERIMNIVKDSSESVTKCIELISSEAMNILENDISMCIAVGNHGEQLIRDSASVLTHCNTGGLATGGFGTALGVLVTAHNKGKNIHVYVDETRPLLQGARLTAWELKKEGIPHTLVCDNMAGYLMQQKKVDCVIVGADRIAMNGDTANKIGTYTLAVLCEKHKIPFYIAAPSSTIDTKITSGKTIVIEERPAEEITNGFGRSVAPLETTVYNPAFDVTPAELISAIITEKQIYKGPRYNFSDVRNN
ncbi:S-methyl-5-thioribose-1-phosphate isomerase [bacterium]|nr:S-methyl-5-thioribose-1-phosphate isomerase [bacterium]